MIDSAMLLLPRQSVARSARPNWSRWQAPRAACQAARACTSAGSSTRSQWPPSACTSAILRGAVQAGITATNGRPEQAREPRLGDRGAARRCIDHGLALAQAAVAQRVQEQRARQPVLEAAGGMRGLVLEIEVDAGKSGECELQQVGVGRARRFLAQLLQRVAVPRRGCRRRQ